MASAVIAVVGLSNSGKTRVATNLIRILTARGYRVAAVKHSPHGHQPDRPGTDSALLFGAGAAKVIVSSPERMTTFQRTSGDATLDEIVGSIDSGYDLVVVEGFKGSSVPKVLVQGAEQISPAPVNVIAVVGENGREGEGVPCYSFQELDGLARQIQGQVLEGSLT